MARLAICEHCSFNDLLNPSSEHVVCQFCRRAYALGIVAQKAKQETFKPDMPTDGAVTEDYKNGDA